MMGGQRYGMPLVVRLLRLLEVVFEHFIASKTGMVTIRLDRQGGTEWKEQNHIGETKGSP